MKRSSTRSGPSCSGFWDTVRNNLMIREMTALMGGDGMMEQQTEKDFRFENDPQAEVFLLSEKTKEKAPSISASCSLWCTSRDSNPEPTDQKRKPPVRLNSWKLRVIVSVRQSHRSSFFAFAKKPHRSAVHPTMQAGMMRKEAR